MIIHGAEAGAGLIGWRQSVAIGQVNGTGNISGCVSDRVDDGNDGGICDVLSYFVGVP